MELHLNKDFASAASANAAIVVMMGLPGSGKTTLCSSLPHVLGSKFHIIHVCYDQIVPFNEHWSCEERHGLWKGERAKVLHSTEVLLCNLMDVKSSHGKINLDYEDVVSRSVMESTSVASNTLFCKDLIPKQEGDLALFSDNLQGKSKDAAEPLGVLINPPPHNVNNESKCMDDSCIGHYTLFSPFNQKSASVEHDIKKCDVQNEVFIFCIDDNFYYRSMRKEWWNLAAKYELPFCIVSLDCKVSTCIGRVRERFNSSSQFGGPNVPPEVIERMADRIEFPDGQLFPWEKHSVIIKSNSACVLLDDVPNIKLPFVNRVNIDEMMWESLNEIKNLLCNALHDPAKPFTQNIHSNFSPVIPSLVHKVDLALRRYVGKSEMSKRAQINKQRKRVLEDLRTGKVNIMNEVLNEDCSEEQLDVFVTKLMRLD